MSTDIRTLPRFVRYREVPTIYVASLDAAMVFAEHGTFEGHVYVTGKPPTSATLIERFGAGADMYLDGHYPIVRPTPGVTITWAGSWWGDDATPEECDHAHDWLIAAIRATWRDDKLNLLLTPTTTGRDLWLRTVTRDGYPVLTERAQRLIRSTSGQGRIETLPDPFPNLARTKYTATAHLYDARMAYTACLRNMPVGEPEHTDGPRAVPSDMYAPYRALVTWDAPRGWTRPGILPMMTGDGWSWPTEGHGWADGAEILVAQRHGWHVEFREVLTYPHRADVFRTWLDRFQRILGGAYAGERNGILIRRAIRAMMLYSIGAFHGRPHKRTHVGLAHEIPMEAGSVRLLEDGERFTWVTESPMRWPQMSHPEWSSAIWARARARLLDTNGIGALHLPPGSVIAFRTDAILTTQRADWPDDGRAGQYRLKGTAPMMAWPANNVAALELKERCEHG